MDDMVFQNNNKNAIYVLNTSYNTYGEFGRPNTFGYPQTNSDEIYNNPKNCSISRSFHKLKSLRLHSSEMFVGGDAGSVGSIEGVSSATESNSSSSMTSCSPTAAALQKLFNCSSGTAHSCRSINYRNNSLSNTNCHISLDLSHHDARHQNNAQKETGKHSHHHHHSQLEYHHLMENQMSLSLRGNNNSTSGGSSGCVGGVGSTSCVLPCVGSGGGSGSGKKKHFTSSNSVKSALIAKKTKFWKYLVEEEKWRKHSDENLSTTNNYCERDRESKSKSGSCSGGNKNNSNWSGNSDTNKNSNINQKSSAELYKEAAQLLGLSCTLCDNCRCLDCQSRYFECDDSDSYSEFSLMDEYFENLPTEGDRNFHHRSTSPSFHHQQEQQHNYQPRHPPDDISTRNEDQSPPVSLASDFQNNAFDHCESLNDLTLEENCIENEN